jgi:hypothetical protein
LILVVNRVVVRLSNATNGYTIVHAVFIDDKSKRILRHLKAGSENESLRGLGCLLTGVP